MDTALSPNYCEDEMGKYRWKTGEKCGCLYWGIGILVIEQMKIAKMKGELRKQKIVPNGKMCKECFVKIKLQYKLSTYTDIKATTEWCIWFHTGIVNTSALDFRDFK